MSDLIWTPSVRKLSELTPWELNPRQISQDQALRLRQSLREFSQAVPMLISPGGLIYDGHQRFKVWALMDEMGPDAEVQVMVSSRDLTEEEQKKLTIYLETASGEWDYEALANNWDVDDLLDWGFTQEELQIDLTGGDGGDGEDQGSGQDEDEVVLAEDKIQETLEEWDVHSGDVWKLGDHLVICGDSTDPRIAGELCKVPDDEGGGPWAVITDPPYGINLDTDYSTMGVSRTVYKKVQGDDHPWDPQAFMDLYQGASSYWLWGADYYLRDLPEGDGSLIVWAKAHQESENAVFGSSFEILWTRPKRKRDIWYILRIRGTGLGVHPTQKPLECMRRPVVLSKAEIVVDPYLGTGTTLIACEREGVICQGAEISPGYVAVILRRWHLETGKNPKRLVDGDEAGRVASPKEDLS